MSKRKINKSAFVMSAGLEFKEQKNENDKGMGVVMVARSANIVESWCFGRTIHDMAGVVHKDRIPLDYVHDPKELVGYGNKISVNDNFELVVEGAVTPQKTHQRAEEIIENLKNGIPYEASIFFGGKEIVIEEIAEGDTVEVNGKEWVGPLTIFRKWPLRGLAICPYGADSETSTKQFSQGDSEIEIEVIGEEKMTDEKNAEAIAEKLKADEAKPEVSEKETSSQEEENAEATAEKLNADEAQPEVSQKETSSKEKDTELAISGESQKDSRSEFKQYIDLFGNSKAAEYFAEGLCLDEAKDRHIKFQSEALKKMQETYGDQQDGFAFDSDEKLASETIIPTEADKKYAKKAGVSAAEFAAMRVKKYGNHKK